MKPYSYRVTVKTDAKVTSEQIMTLIENGVVYANGCADPKDMIDGKFEVRVRPLREKETLD